MRKLNEETIRKMEGYIREKQRREGRSPSFRNIMHALGMSSLNLVQRYVVALERQGRINRTEVGRIALPQRLDTGKVTIAPLVGDIACGEPSFAEDSMKDVGIRKGDLIVVRRQNYADDGQIVVALIDGEATLKRLFHRNGEIVLHPENKQMQDIVVENCEVQGVLVSCIKMY